MYFVGSSGVLVHNECGDDFASQGKKEEHFDKHKDDFGGFFKNANEYLEGARDVIQNGYKVEYYYKPADEIRIGYVRFMANTSKGFVRFEFVGTNNLWQITESGKSFWKMLNGKNIPLVNPTK